MPFWRRRVNRARLQPAPLSTTSSLTPPSPPSPPSPPPSPSMPLPQPPQPAQSQPVSLSNAELHYILVRRLRNDNLPDDPHTLLAERVTSLITVLSSFCAKLYLLERTPLVNLPTRQPRLALFLRILAISQLRPLRLLTLPLIRVFRPLSWLLAPFATMSLPVTVHILAKCFIRHVTPTPPPRPKFVDNLVERAAEVCDTVTDTFNRARDAIESDLNQLFDAPPPQLPALSDIIPPPLSHLVAPETFHPENVEASNTPEASPAEEETLIRSPLPALRRRGSRRGLSALTGPGAGITVSSTTRSQRGFSSEMGSEVGSDTGEEKSWWYKG